MDHGVLAFTEDQQERSGHEDGTVSAHQHAHDHHERKEVDAFAAEPVEHGAHEKDGGGREDGSAQGLVHAVVDHLRREGWVLAADFPDSVEDHDRVAHGVTHEREQGGDGREVDLEILEAEDPADGRVEEEVARRDASECEAEIVNEAEDGGEAEGPVAEPEPEVEHDRDPTRDDGVERLRAGF